MSEPSQEGTSRVVSAAVGCGAIRRRGWAALCLMLQLVFAHAEVIQLDIDATDAPRKLLHARMSVPAKPGKLTLVYPKWIPGEHGPTGPITDLMGLEIRAAGNALEWQRDDVDMYAFHLTVPPGARLVELAFDFLLPPSTGGFSSGASATAQLLDLSWNQVLLYPKGLKAGEIQFAPSLRLPAGWKFGTALPLTRRSGDTLEFEPISLETLVDSPVIAGSFFRSVDLSPGATPPHRLDMVADSAAALEIKPEDVLHFSRLVDETGALFGARHYRDYHFLLTLSDHVAHFGLEHHESSDDRMAERYLTDADTLKLDGFLLPHEMVHSWNGKYRRPLGLATPDYQQPMKGELLWVYEGLTDYLGVVLATRCGLWTNATFCEYLAMEAAMLDQEPGRTWRPLSDTTVAAQLLYAARPEGNAWRRSVDFYPEGDLIWLEADVLIRQQTQGRRSIDDFCKSFYGGENCPPKVIPYTFEDLVNALDKIAPCGWREFFRHRVYEAEPRAPLGGVRGAGWRLTYTNQIPDRLRSIEAAEKFTDVTFSLGLLIKEDGYITDVIPGSPADRAGIGTTMKLLAVNDRHWTPEVLRTAIKAAQSGKAPIRLLLENEEYFRTFSLDYHNGERYPQLERDASKPDLLAEILKPRSSPK